MIPLQLLNAKGKCIVEGNLNNYRKKLENIDESEVVSVSPEVGVPIVEKLTYVTNAQLVDLYAELLAKASIKSQCNLAHPNFVNIINSLSPDEALLIKILREKQNIPFIDRTLQKRSGEYQVVQPLITGLEDTNGLIFPNNIPAYLSNLEALGLLKTRRDTWSTNNNLYEQLGKRHQISVHAGSEYKPDVKKGIIEVTNLGRMFIQSCVGSQA